MPYGANNRSRESRHQHTRGGGTRCGVGLSTATGRGAEPELIMRPGVLHAVATARELQRQPLASFPPHLPVTADAAVWQASTGLRS